MATKAWQHPMQCSVKSVLKECAGRLAATLQPKEGFSNTGAAHARVMTSATQCGFGMDWEQAVFVIEESEN